EMPVRIAHNTSCGVASRARRPPRPRPGAADTGQGERTRAVCSRAWRTAAPAPALPSAASGHAPWWREARHGRQGALGAPGAPTGVRGPGLRWEHETTPSLEFQGQQTLVEKRVHGCGDTQRLSEAHDRPGMRLE